MKRWAGQKQQNPLETGYAQCKALYAFSGMESVNTQSQRIFTTTTRPSWYEYQYQKGWTIALYELQTEGNTPIMPTTNKVNKGTNYPKGKAVAKKTADTPDHTPVSYNRVKFTGNLGKDVDSAYTAQGTGWARSSIAVYMGKDAEGNKLQQWFKLVAWSNDDSMDEQTFETFQQMAKGTRVTVEGRLSHSLWTNKQGDDVTDLQITLTNVYEEPFDGKAF